MNEERKDTESISSSNDLNLGSGCIAPNLATIKVPVSLYVVAGLLLASGISLFVLFVFLFFKLDIVVVSFAIWEIWTGWQIVRLRYFALDHGRFIQGIKIFLSLINIAGLCYLSKGALEGTTEVIWSVSTIGLRNGRFANGIDFTSFSAFEQPTVGALLSFAWIASLLYLAYSVWMFRVLRRQDVRNIFEVQPRPEKVNTMSLTRFMLMVTLFLSVLLTLNRLVFLQRDNNNRAIISLSNMIELNPQVPHYYWGRGKTWYAMGEYDKAIADYDEAILLAPYLAEQYSGRSDAWYAKGEYDKAIADLNEAIRLDPKDSQALVRLTWLYATCPNAKYRDGKKAVEIGTKACELSSWKDDNDLENLAAGYAEAGNFEKAKEYLKKAVELNPGKNKGIRESMQKLFAEGRAYHEESK